MLMKRILYFLTITLSLVLTFGLFSSSLALAATSGASSANSPDILVPAVQGPSVKQRLESRAKASWPWYITRAAGFVAAFALVILILSGVGLITGYTFRILEPLTAWATHKAIAMVFGVAVIVHITALLFDKYVPFTIATALVPFASNYRNVTIAGHHLGSLYVALGIFAFYILLAIIISSLLWIDKKPYTWKAIHFLAYLVMIFVFFHALYLGTDLAHGIFRILWIIFGVAVAVAIVYRLSRKTRAT